MPSFDRRYHFCCIPFEFERDTNKFYFLRPHILLCFIWLNSTCYPYLVKFNSINLLWYDCTVRITLTSGIIAIQHLGGVPRICRIGYIGSVVFHNSRNRPRDEEWGVWTGCNARHSAPMSSPCGQNRQPLISYYSRYSDVWAVRVRCSSVTFCCGCGFSLIVFRFRVRSICLVRIRYSLIPHVHLFLAIR